MSNNQKHTENIKKSIDDVIGANTVLKRKKKTEDDINREKFELIIRTLEEVEVRAMLMEQDFDLIFGAARMGLKIVEVPIIYRERTYGETNISRWKHGVILLAMLIFSARKIKFI